MRDHPDVPEGLRPRVAVTGAGGFIGRALEERLAPRARLRGLFRTPSPVSDAWQAKGHEVILGNLDDREALRALLEGVDVVHHLAARMKKDDPEASRRVNVDGTKRLARAARLEGVRRFVYVSSISVYAATPTRDGTVTEEMAPRDTGLLNPYSRTKYEGECVLRELRRVGEGPELTIVRPTNVYGPWARSWFLDWVGRLQRIPVVLGGNIPVDVVHVRDVAGALVRAGERPQAADETFHIGHETVTLTEFGARVGEVLGRRIWKLPAPVDYLIRASVERFHPLVKGDRMSMSLTRPVRYPHDRATRLLGYVPEVDLDEGFAALGRWYRRVYLPNSVKQS